MEAGTKDMYHTFYTEYNLRFWSTLLKFCGSHFHPTLFWRPPKKGLSISLPGYQERPCPPNIKEQTLKMGEIFKVPSRKKCTANM